MDLSIIIPVYNTPVDLLKRCFDSIRVEEEIHMEVLIIDDGSDFETSMFCKEYQSRNRQFQYMYMDNAGVSAARNMGINKAMGRYIMFVDSDDTIEGRAIRHKWLDLGIDVIFFDIFGCNHRFDNKVNVFEHEAGFLKKEDVLDIVLFSNRLNEVFGKLIKRDLLLNNNVYFDTSMAVAEDKLFILNIVLHAAAMYYCNEIIYEYFYSYNNGKQRLIRKFDSVIHSCIRFYFMSKKALAENAGNIETAAEKFSQYYCAAESWTVENLFNNIATYMAIQDLPNVKRKQIYKEIKELQIEYSRYFSLRTKIKYLLLHMKAYYLIKIIAKIREKYIEMRLGRYERG